MGRNNKTSDKDGENDMERAKKNLQRALAIDDGYMPAFNQLALYYFERAKNPAGAAAPAPGKDAIRTTNKQNLLLLNIPEANLESLKKELDALGLDYAPTNFRKGCVSCTGIEFCNLAVA